MTLTERDRSDLHRRLDRILDFTVTSKTTGEAGLRMMFKSGRLMEVRVAWEECSRPGKHLEQKG